MWYRNCDIETIAHPNAQAWAEPVKAPRHYRDETKIADYIKAAELAYLEDAALHGHRCRIVAIGYEDISHGHGEPQVTLCSNELEERHALIAFWDSWATFTAEAKRAQFHTAHYDRRDPLFLGFRNLSFDLPILMVRSRYLQVKYPGINIDKYRSPHVDLYKELTYNGVLEGASLKWFAKRHDIPVYDDINGADVGAAVARGDYQAVHDHCLSDLTLVRALAEKIGILPPTAVA